MLEGLGEAEGEGEQSLSCALILCPKGPNSVRPSGTRSLQHTPKLERTFYASAIADDRSSPDKNLRDAGALLPPPPPHLVHQAHNHHVQQQQQQTLPHHGGHHGSGGGGGGIFHDHASAAAAAAAAAAGLAPHHMTHVMTGELWVFILN